MSYDKYQVKEALDIDDVYEILLSLGAEPEIKGDYIIAKTICHHHDDVENASRKLYYYSSTQLFRCFTHCGTFDIFELLQKVRGLDLNEAVYYVVNFFNLQWKIQELDDTDILEDVKITRHWKDLADIHINHELVTLPEIDGDILKHYPQPHIKSWEEEHISKDVCDFMGIRYDPVNGAVLIPHTDENGRLVGIRRRTLVQEEERWGKYRPWQHGATLYNHPLGFNLYGYDKAKENIRRVKVAMVVESEKATMQSIGYLGLANDICVAVCGSSISKYQLQMLERAGADEIVIAFDADFEKVGDEGYFRTIDKLKKISSQYNGRANFSYMFDKKGEFIHSKMSPTEAGKDVFMQLWRDRFTLNR